MDASIGSRFSLVRTAIWFSLITWEAGLTHHNLLKLGLVCFGKEWKIIIECIMDFGFGNMS
jgi:hypothetical protein